MGLLRTGECLQGGYATVSASNTFGGAAVRALEDAAERVKKGAVYRELAVDHLRVFAVLRHTRVAQLLQALLVQVF